MRASVFAGAVVACVAAASPSYALNLSGSYLATFAVSTGGDKTVCFTLASNGAKQSYTDTGTVTATNYPAYSGTYVVYKSGFHLAFVSSGRDSVAVTGVISKNTVINTSATEFTTAGAIDKVGTFTASKGCSAALVQ